MSKLIQSVLLTVLLCLSFLTQADQHFQFKTQSPIYVVGDIHGAYNEIHTILKTIELIDEDNNWSGGKSHFVSLGDMMDRGPSSRKVMDLYMKLQAQAELAGGKFHIVLGNHEVMNLTGDLRYLSLGEYTEFAVDESDKVRIDAYQHFLEVNSLSDDDKAKFDFNEKFPKGYFAHQAAFSTTGKYGQWLLELPFIIQINDQLFAHGGLHSGLKGESIESINEILKKSLVNYLKSWEELVRRGMIEFDLPFNERIQVVSSLKDSRLNKRFIKVQKQLLFSLNSPTWYRGNSICHPYYETDLLASTLQSWESSRLWVGHTPTANKLPNYRLNNQLIIMDTGMLKSYYKGQSWAAKLNSDNSIDYIDGITGEKGISTQSANRTWSSPYGMSDEELELFLQTATVTKQGTTEYGITKPIRVTLEKEGKKIKGVFKYFDDMPGSEKKKWSKTKEKNDRFMHDIAAYKLDRILGIGLVPVTVQRTIDGQPGIIQLWINNLISKLVMKKNKIEYNGYCDKKAQRDMMKIFDYLSRNTDRNQSNIMYTQDDWQLWFIDHSRAFGTSVIAPKNLKLRNTKLTDTFREALQSIKREDLDALRPWIHRKQVVAVWKRRNRLLNGKFSK